MNRGLRPQELEIITYTGSSALSVTDREDPVSRPPAGGIHQAARQRW